MKKIFESKKTIISIGAIAIIAVMGVTFGIHSTSNNNPVVGDIPVSELHGSFTINHDSIDELIGDADYVFVGSVISEDGTEYKHAVMGETEDGKEIEIASPYTNYTINVLENIKGELVTDTDIPIQKAGGLAQDGSQYFVYEEDELPVEGDIYVFYAYAQPDGSLLVSGPNSNTKVNIKATAFNDSLIDTLETASEVQEVVDALDSQVETSRQRFVSSYDVSQ